MHMVDISAGDISAPQVEPEEFVLPPSDYDRSPITGWTRAHWESVADRWLSHIARYSTGEGARPRLPGRVTWAGVAREGMETIARSFLLAAPRIAASSDAESDALAERYARALLAGTQPDGAEAWPLGVTCRTPLVGVTQSIVEAAHIAFALSLCTDRLWDGFTRPEQLQIAGWLRHHGRTEVWQNNWQLFPAMCEGFLTSVGEDVSGCNGQQGVDRVESWYLGDGWYTDGPRNAVDYYNAWTIHPFLWAWYRMTARTQTAQAQRHLERLSEYIAAFSTLIADDGAVVHVGRSLTYRTAMLAPLWCAEISGVSPLNPGQTRALASSVLKNFVERGVGVNAPLSLGWYGPHEPMTQSYSGYGSPYLAGLGFMGLAVPGSGPVWDQQEEAASTRGASLTESWRAVGWRVDAAGDGVVRLVNHGSDHAWMPVEAGRDADDPHYAKLAYSTHTAPGTGDAWQDNVDSHIALITHDGRASRRCAIRGTRVEDRFTGSVHLPQLDGVVLPGAAITTISASEGAFEVRAHRILTETVQTVREGGFAVADEKEPSVNFNGARAWAMTSDGLCSAVIGLYGWDSADTARYTGSNAMGHHSACPVLWGRTAPGATALVTLHVLTHSSPPDLDAWSRAVDATVDGDQLKLTWPSGRTDEIDLANFVPWDGALAAPPEEK